PTPPGSVRRTPSTVASTVASTLDVPRGPCDDGRDSHRSGELGYSGEDGASANATTQATDATQRGGSDGAPAGRDHADGGGGRGGVEHRAPRARGRALHERPGLRPPRARPPPRRRARADAARCAAGGLLTPRTARAVRAGPGRED